MGKIPFSHVISMDVVFFAHQKALCIFTVGKGMEVYKKDQLVT